MAINIPYHSSVEPIVPDAQRNIAPELLSRGLAVLGQMAAERQKIQLESEQMATDAALKSRQLDIARENNLLDFNVGMKNAEALSNYRNTMAGIENDPTNPLSKAGRINLAREKLQTFSDFNKQAADLGLFESNPKNPVDYYLKFRRLNDEFAFADDMPEIKNALAEFKMRTEQHAIPLREGMKFDPKKNTWSAGGETRQIPVGDVIDRLNDPDKSEATWQMLERNGYVTSATTDVKIPGKKPKWLTDWMEGKDTISKGIGEAVGAIVPSASYPSVTKTLAPSFGKYMEMSKGADFSRGKPRTPAAGVLDTTSTLPASRDGQQEVTTRDVGDATARMQSEQSPDLKNDPLFPETDSEKTLKQAKLAASKPGANIDGIKAMLQSKGIDPNLLDQ